MGDKKKKKYDDEYQSLAEEERNVHKKMFNYQCECTHFKKGSLLNSTLADDDVTPILKCSKCKMKINIGSHNPNNAVSQTLRSVRYLIEECALVKHELASLKNDEQAEKHQEFLSQTMKMLNKFGLLFKEIKRSNKKSKSKDKDDSADDNTYEIGNALGSNMGKVFSGDSESSYSKDKKDKDKKDKKKKHW
jgi:hypothetical protein